MPEGSDVIVIKMRLRVFSDVNSLMDNLIDFELRTKWDT